MNEQLDEGLAHENKMGMYDERVGFGRRFGAYMLDILVMIILGYIISSVIGEQLVELFFSDQLAEAEFAATDFESIGFDYMGMMTKMTNIIAGTSIVAVLLFLMEGVKGQSFGKMMLKIENTNVDGSKADAKKLWIRSLLKYGSTILSLLGGLVGLSFIGTIGNFWWWIIFIGFFFSFADKKQTIHDMIARTVVSWK
ncbi:MAG: RDD family protein [Vicingaceae bacterium]